MGPLVGQSQKLLESLLTVGLFSNSEGGFGCKMSGCQNVWSGKMSCLLNVWVSKCLDLYAVAQCLGGTMSGWLNVLGSKMSFFSKVSKCLGDTMSGWQNVSATQCLGVKMSVRQNVKVSKCWGVKMSRLQNVGCRDVGEPCMRPPTVEKMPNMRLPCEASSPSCPCSLLPAILCCWTTRSSP